jgi:predicted phosphodiesterase
MIFLGDTHGNNNYIKWYIKNRKIENTNIIHVGDFGVGFIGEFQERNNLGEFNKFLREKGITLYVFRGNHDNPDYFKGQYFDGPMAFTNIKLCPDYTILELEGKKILGVGGAISIDRIPRRKMNMDAARVGGEQRYHWGDEEFVLDEEKTREFRDIDIVVTHTAPEFVYPVNSGKTWPFIVQQFIDGGDVNLGQDLMDERAKVTEFHRILQKENNIKWWFYGHFHTEKMETIGNTTFKLLNINEMYELKDYTEFEDEMNEKYGEDE